MNEISRTPHSLKYEAGRITVTGVKAVESYDEKSAEILLFDGLLTIKGSGLKLEETDIKSGNVILSGALHSLDYHAKAENIGLIKRIFR